MKVSNIKADIASFVAYDDNAETSALSIISRYFWVDFCLKHLNSIISAKKTVYRMFYRV